MRPIYAVAASACLLLSACAATPRAQPDPTAGLTLEERVARYVATWGGLDSQYRVILTADCDAATNLMDSALANADDDPAGSPQWRAHNGYANAASDRVNELDC